ncbi:hypothetical protein Tco_0556532 [Tanacetum coccineum]
MFLSMASRNYTKSITFFNSLNSYVQDALIPPQGGNFLDKMPHEGFSDFESMSKLQPQIQELFQSNRGLTLVSKINAYHHKEAVRLWEDPSNPREEDSIFIEVPKLKAKKTVNLDPNPNSYQSKLPYPERMKFNFKPDPRVPIILGRPFLRTVKALIDLYEEKLTLRVGNDELVYYADKSKKNKEKNCVHAISIIDFSKDDPFSGSTTNTLHHMFPSTGLFPGLSLLLPLPLTSTGKKVEFEAYLESDSIPPGIDLTLPPTLEVSSCNPTSPTLNQERKPKLLSRPPEVEEIKEKEDNVSSDVPINTIAMLIRITFDNPIDF